MNEKGANYLEWDGLPAVVRENRCKIADDAMNALDAEADARVEAMREQAEATAAWKLRQWATEGHPVDDRMIEAVKSAIASLPAKGSPT